MGGSDGATNDGVDRLESLLEAETEDDVAATPDGSNDDDDEPSEADDFGFKVGWIVAVLAVGSMFVGPLAVLELSFDQAIPLESTGVSGYGPVPFVVGATFVLAFVAALVFPRVAEEQTEGYEVDMALSMIMPTIMLVAALFALTLFFPVVHYALAGKLLYATGFLLGMALVVAIAMHAFTVIAAAGIVAFLYLLLPALIGTFGARFVRGVGRAISP